MAFDCIASITLHLFEHDDEPAFLEDIITFLEHLEQKYDMAEKITVFNSLLEGCLDDKQRERLRKLGYSP